MSKGKAIAISPHVPGLVGHSEAPNWDFLYRASTDRDPNYNIGDRVALPDGRVFRYAKASGTLNSDLLAQHVTGQHVGYNALGASQSVGDKQITITVVAATEGVGGAGVIAEDELRGGNVIIFPHSENSINMGIIGNKALAADGTSLVVYLDATLPIAVDITADHAECIASPYSSVKASTTGDANRAFVGLPMRAATTLQYVWLQTWGPCWVAPQSNAGAAAHSTQVVARYDGTIQAHDDTDSAVLGTDQQHVGFVLSRGAAAAQGAPFIMLQISP